MTVPAQNPHNAILANGATTVFPYAFLTYNAANIEVRINNVVQTSGYTVSGVGNVGGGSVTFLTAPANGAIVDITGNVPYSRTTDFQNLGDLLAGTLNRDQDDPVLMIQQLSFALSQTLKMPLGVYPAANTNLPSPLPGSLLGWSSDGTSIVNLGGSGVGGGSIVDGNINNSGISSGKIYYTPSGGIQKFLDDMWSQNLYVENFGAIGDGVTNDQAAFIAMHAAVGYIRLRKKTYFIDNWVPPVAFTAFALIGSGKASFDQTFTKYLDGTGSIIVGRIYAQASFAVARDFSVDVGDTRSNITSQRDGLIIDAPVGQNGTYCTMENIGSCGSVTSGTTHGILMEGFNAFYVRNVEILQHNYGCVIKSRNGYVGKVRGYGTKVAGLYLRGSSPAQGGNVASAAVDNVFWEDVITDSFTSTLTQPGYAVFVEASTANVTRVTGRGAHANGGRGCYRASAVAPYLIAGVHASDLRANGTTLCWETLGTSFEITVDNYYAENPSSGEAFETDTISTNWRANNGTIVITLAGITGTSVGLMRGTGSWDGLICRTINTMLITHNLTAIRGGRKTGTVAYSGEGTLALGGSIVAAAGEIVPKIMMKPDNTIVLHGVLNPSAGSSALAGLSGSMNFGTNRYFALCARTTGGAYATAYVIASGTSLSLLAPAANTLNQISLDGIIIHSD
jgi:hypothetical protein